MKNLKLILTFILVFSIFFAGSCATKKKTIKDAPSSAPVVNTIQPIKPPASESAGSFVEIPDSESNPADEYVYEFDAIVDVAPQKIPEPELEYPNQQSTPSQVAEREEEEVEVAEVMEVAERAEEVLEVADAVIENSAGVSPAETIAVSSAANIVGINETAAGTRAFGSPGGPGGKERRNSNLVGAGSVNVEGVMDYIKIRNRNPSFNEEHARKIINSYIDEAVKEDVNYDFAIAQMLYWTAFLTNKQRVESNNLAGLQSSKNWNGKFSTMEEGVRAHIQHLRGYSYKTLKNPNTKIVDPRWEHIGNSRGTVKNFEQIYPIWSASSERYRRNIILILNDSYRYSDRYSSLYK